MASKSRHSSILFQIEREAGGSRLVTKWVSHTLIFVLHCKAKLKRECARTGAGCGIHVRALSHSECSAVKHTTWKRHS